MDAWIPFMTKVTEDYVGMKSFETESKKLIEMIGFLTTFHTGKTFSGSGSEQLSA